MSLEAFSSGNEEAEVSSEHGGLAIRGGRARHVKHSVKRVRQAVRHVCTCSVAGQSVEIKTDSPPILESGDRVLVAGPIRGGTLRSYVAENLDHEVEYMRSEPWALSALGIAFLSIGWIAFVSALFDARWPPRGPLWWTVFPLALAALCFLLFEGAGAWFLYRAQEIRRARQILDDGELRARLGGGTAAGLERAKR